jgi:hypothetical protein
VEFCRDPRPAADRLPGSADLVTTPAVRGRAMLRRDVDLIREYLDAGGPGELARRVGGRALKVAKQRLRRG